MRKGSFSQYWVLLGLETCFTKSVSFLLFIGYGYSSSSMSMTSVRNPARFQVCVCPLKRNDAALDVAFAHQDKCSSGGARHLRPMSTLLLCLALAACDHSRVVAMPVWLKRASSYFAHRPLLRP